MENQVWKKYENIDAAIYEKEQQINKIHLNWDKLVNKNSEEKVLQTLDKLQEEKEELIRSACSFLSNRNTTLMREGTKAKKEIKAQQNLENKKEEVKPQIKEETKQIIEPVDKKEEQIEEKQKQRLKKEQLLLEIKRKVLAKEISLEDASKLVYKVAAIYGNNEPEKRPKSMKKVA